MVILTIWRSQLENLTLPLLYLFGDGGDHFVEGSDYRPTSFGDHVGFGVGVDGEDVLAAHGTHPVLGGS